VRKPTTLEQFEAACYETIASGDAHQVHDGIATLGMTHLAMDPDKLPAAIRELWASMHGRSGLASLAIAVTAAGYIASGYNDPLTQEYAAALRDRQRS
jgi:hypothetical protein